MGGPITPYLGGAGASEQIRACPSFADDLDRLRASGAGFESGAGGYGYNNTFVGQVRRMTHPGIWAVESDREGSRRWRFASPSRTIAFTDAAYAPSWDDSEPAEYSFAEPRFWPENPAYRPEPTIHFRHSGSASVAWLDGHVDAQVRTRGAGNPTGAPGSSDRLVGWFGAADDNSLFDYD
ncbi:MAG: hypothetical protein VYC34_08240 [Planctomycetota bacterium]|nr:hypothetical protein [Planctomycetota bacterium]